jgi:RNA polymerase sigma-B factor
MTAPVTLRYRRHEETDARGLALFRVLADVPPRGPDHERIRTTIIELYLPFAERVVYRFGTRGEQLDDLLQIARLGLVKAVDGYDVGRGIPFVGYAMPTIIGELKRHFRDRRWDIRPPRRVQDLRRRIARATDELGQRTGTTPTATQLSGHLQAPVEDVIEALAAGRAFHLPSLEAPVGHDGTLTLGDRLGTVDPAFERIEHREALRALVPTLSRREQTILVMRFYDNLTQHQIGAHLGLSQMQVSRLIRDTLAHLRRALLKG